MKSTILDKFALCAGLLLAPLASGAALPVAGQDPISLVTTPPVLAEPQSEATPVPIQGDSKCLVSLSTLFYLERYPRSTLVLTQFS